MAGPAPGDSSGSASSGAPRIASQDPGKAGWLAFTGCCAVWGSTFLFISIGNDVLPPVWAVTLRLGFAAPILALLTRLTGQSLPRGRALQAAVLYGLCQFAIDLPLLYWGEKYIPSGLSAVLFGTIPLTSALFAHAFGLERINPIKLAGAVVAIGGVAVIGSGSRGGTTHLLGVLAVLASATTAALGSIFLKRGPRQSAFGANAVGCAVGFAFCLPVSRLMGESWVVPPSAAAWFSIAYLTLAGSVGAFALVAWLIQRWPVTRVAFISVVIPVVATFLGVVVRHEPLTPSSLGGSVLVMAGLGIGITADRLVTRRTAAAAH
jgi:drug/metabolite transporter (DMT)-like permease